MLCSDNKRESSDILYWLWIKVFVYKIRWNDFYLFIGWKRNFENVQTAVKRRVEVHVMWSETGRFKHTPCSVIGWIAHGRRDHSCCSLTIGRFMYGFGQTSQLIIINAKVVIINPSQIVFEHKIINHKHNESKNHL